MKVAELTGALLALWVAKCEGIEKAKSVKLYASGPCLYRETPEGGGEPFDFRPDSRWSHGGPIIERKQICVRWIGEEWVADHMSAAGVFIGFGPTALIAAMRCCVASEYGEEVPEVPA